MVCEAGPTPGAGAGVVLRTGSGKMRTGERPNGGRWWPSLDPDNVRLRDDPLRADAGAPGLHGCWHMQRHTGHWMLEPAQTLRKLREL